MLGAAGTLLQAIRSGGGARITLAALGLIGVLGAGFNGGSFLKDNQNFSSMPMSVGFALAASVYVADSPAAPRQRQHAPDLAGGIGVDLTRLEEVRCLLSPSRTS